MKDPTRIPPLLSLVQDLWEALPDLEFADVLRMLDSAGVQQLDDEAAAVRLTKLCAEYPRRLDGRPAVAHVDRWAISVDAQQVAVRGVHGNQAQPVVWEYDRIVNVQVGAPLHIVDTSGQHRRFGVVQRIQPLDVDKLRLEALPELHRDGIGDRHYLVQLGDGGMLSIGRRLSAFAAYRRHTTRESLAWSQVRQRGEVIEVRLRDGGGARSFEPVVHVYRVA
ncbi:hypothetical protein HW450_05375 [Corynebacterium hindlerae]|uniref:Uncharacterized protein n=1 Tax=Corynebacterium hindlerae TaxID=699041 RepID=A0A7G5FHQ4_9CORY|nr:hypothetical protein [Corynebacterium hindlerae]QMV86145.1 hypothetical protein HW450_05375 [Corynebacterium hindlerae]